MDSSLYVCFFVFGYDFIRLIIVPRGILAFYESEPFVVSCAFLSSVRFGDTCYPRFVFVDSGPGCINPTT